MSYHRIHTAANGKNQCGYSMLVAPVVRDILLAYSKKLDLNPDFSRKLDALKQILYIVDPDAKANNASALEALMPLLARCAKPGVNQITFDRSNPESAKQLLGQIDWALLQAYIAEPLENANITLLKNSPEAKAQVDRIAGEVKTAYLRLQSDLSEGADVDIASVEAVLDAFNIRDEALRAGFLAWAASDSDQPTDALRNLYFNSFKGATKSVDILNVLYKTLNINVNVYDQSTQRTSRSGTDGLLNIYARFVGGSGAGMVDGHFEALLSNDDMGLAQVVEEQAELAKADPYAARDAARKAFRTDVAVRINLTDVPMDAEDDNASVTTQDSADSTASTRSLVDETRDLFSQPIELPSKPVQDNFEALLKSGNSTERRDHAIALAYQEALVRAGNNERKIQLVEKAFFGGADRAFVYKDANRNVYKTAAVLFNREETASAEPQHTPTGATPP